MRKGIGIIVCILLIMTIAVNTTMIIKGLFFDTMPSVFGYVPLIAGENIERTDIKKGDMVICKERGRGEALAVTHTDGDYSGFAYYTGVKLAGVGAVSEFFRTPVGIVILVILILLLSFAGDRWEGEKEKKEEVFYPARKGLEVK